MPLTPHGVAGAARSHARLGYAGGSRWAFQSADFGDPQGCGIFHTQLAAGHLDILRNIPGRQNANDDRHVGARLADMFGKRVVVVIIDRVLVNHSAGMAMSHDMAMTLTVRVAENKAEIVVAGIAGRGFRRGNKHPLDRKGKPCRHHDDGSHALKKLSPSKAQCAGPSEIYEEIISCGVPVSQVPCLPSTGESGE